MLSQEERLKALQDIERAAGRLTPEAVVEAARDPASPLHGWFTWDDEAAAHMQRIYQARRLIASVRVVVRTDSRVVSSVFYVRDPSLPVESQGYVSLPTLRTDEDLAREALLQEFGRAAAALQRARELAAALSMQDEVELMLERVQALRQRVQERPSAN